MGMPCQARFVVLALTLLTVSCANAPVERVAAIQAGAGTSVALPEPATLPAADTWVAHLTCTPTTRPTRLRCAWAPAGTSTSSVCVPIR